MPTRRDLLVGGAAAAGGAAIAIPALLKSRQRVDDSATGELIPQLFGARGDGRDDTAAFHDMASAAASQRRPMKIPAADRPYAIGPWRLPETAGLRLGGASTRTSRLVPVARDQPFLLHLPGAAVGARVEHLGFFEASSSDRAGCACAVLSDAAQELALVNLRVDGFRTGVWAREGGYARLEAIYVARAPERGFAFGGGESGKQFSQSVCIDLTCDSGLLDGQEQKSRGVAFDLDSGAAFLRFRSLTAAGQSVGARIHDSRGKGLESRPDGLFLFDANIDWTAQEALLIESAGRVLVQGANLRSIKSFAARMRNFNSVDFFESNVYASAAGIALEGGFNDFYWRGSRAVGNESVGIALNGGSGQVLLEGGVIGSGDRDARPGAGYYPLAVTSRQKRGLTVAPAFTGPLTLDSVSFAGNDVAAIDGLAQGGRLRSATVVRNVDAFRTHNYGVEHALRVDAGGLFAIDHRLAVTPSWANVRATNAGVAVEVLSLGATMLNCRASTASAPLDIAWEARV